ncbi:TolB family protein [Nonomuraea sp. NPDC002799]
MIAKLAVALSLLLASHATLPADARADVALPGTGGVTYREQSGDPVRLTAYGLGTKRTYLRSTAGTAFAWEQTLSEVSAAPGGRLIAGVPAAYRSGYDSLVVTDRTTGATSRIRTVARPQTASYASWSRDGRKVALTVEQKSAGKWQVLGFTVVDVTAKSARTVKISGLRANAGFWWSPDGNLVAMYGTGLRVYRPSDGAVLRTYADVGLPTGPEDAYSPSGRRLTTWCPARLKAQLCLVDPATGKIAGQVGARPAALFGWWDESHLIAVMANAGAYRLSVLDLSGKTTRVLADLPAGTWAADLWLSFTRAAAPAS